MGFICIKIMLAHASIGNLSVMECSITGRTFVLHTKDVGSSPTISTSFKGRWQKGYALDCKSMGFPMEVQVLPDSICIPALVA